MDEPASALDPISTLKIEELIDQLKQQYTIAIVTHNLQQAGRVSQYTGFLPEGEVDRVWRYAHALLTAGGQTDRRLHHGSIRLVAATRPGFSKAQDYRRYRPSDVRAGSTEVVSMVGRCMMPRESFHQELREIEEAVIQMASLVENSIARAMQALVRRDTLLAEDVKTSDGMVNELQRSIRNRCISVMARQAPVARDLRELTTVQLVINELERMGDHAVGIAKQVARLQDFEPLAITGELSEMAKLVREQVHAGIEAFIDVNVQQARDICAKDDEIDHEYKAIFAELLGVMSKDAATIPPATSLLFVAHDLERIGDRVTNICEDVIYMVSGEIEELN